MTPIALDYAQAPVNARRLTVARRLAIVCFVALFGFFYVQNLHRILGREHHQADFYHFYAATVAMSNGEELYQSGTGGYVYPPLLAFLYLPLSHLPDQWAATVALSINIPLIIGSLYVVSVEMIRRFARRDDRFTARDLVPWIMFWAGAVTFGRLKAEIQMLQVDVLVLAAYAFGFYWLDRRPILAGTVLGFAMNVKYYTAPALIYFLLRRRFTAATSFIVSTIAFALLPALKLGMATNWRYLSIATSGVLRSIGVNVSDEQFAHVHKVYESLSVSVTSAIARWVLHTHPSWTMPLTGCVIGICVLVAAAMYRHRRLPFILWSSAAAQSQTPYRQLIPLEWAGIMVAAIAFSPDSNMRHMVLILFANQLALYLLFSSRGAIDRVLLVTGIIVEVLAFDSTRAFPGGSKEMFFHAGGQAWAVLVFFALLLWVGLKRTEQSESPPIRS